MHEFSLCRSVIKIVEKQVEFNSETHRISKVILSVGVLAGVDVESMAFWFPVAAKSSILKNTKLKIETDEAKALCSHCHNIYSLTQLYQSCVHCQSYDKKILSGQQMNVKNIELTAKINEISNKTKLRGD